MIVIRKNSLQTKLMIFFIVITMALFLTFGILFLRSTHYAINTSTENELTTLSQETENKIERFLFERYGDIQVMAQSPLLKNKGIADSLKLQYLQSVRKAYETYDFIFITDSVGRISVLSGNLNGDDNYKSWLNYVLKGNIYVSDFAESSSHQPYAVYFAAPIVDDKGVVEGAVVERMNFNSIMDIVNNVHPSKLGRAYLSGEDSFKSSMDSVESSKTENPNIFYNTSKGVEYISAYFPIKKYSTQKKSWYLVVQEPVSEAFKIANDLRNYTLIVILISVLVLLIMTSVMSVMITKPIKQLVAETQSIAGGDIRQNINVEGTDEVGSLARSFNLLLSNLKSMMQQVLEVSGEAAYLEEIRQYAEKLFDNIPSAVITLDSTGKITTFNNAASEITGIGQNIISGKNIKGAEVKILSPIIKLLTNGLEREVIYLKHIVQLKSAMGKEIPIVINTSIQKDSKGKVLGAIGVFRRAEEIKNVEESVLRARNLASLGALSSGMAHEIRNPLTSIKGYAQYIKAELGEAHELAPDISIIINEVDRLNGIIDRFLTFARPKQPDLKPSNINFVVKNVLKLIEKDLLPSNIKVFTDFTQVPPVLLDDDQIEQVFLNIILNSIQAMPNGGTISINSRYMSKSNTVEVGVQDEGIGIPSGNYLKIFEPFFTTKDKGTGLGLAICSRIMENHNGLIEVESTPDIGTQFVIKFPVKI